MATFVLSGMALPALAGPSELAEAVRRLEGQEASFTQRFLPRGYKNEQVESGTVVFGESPKSRWTYHSPEEKTFVFDGTTSWMYVPADETVTIHKVTDGEKARLPFVLLSNPDDLIAAFEYAERGAQMILTARSKDQLLALIVVEISDSGVVRQLQYEDQQGNRTSFDLEELHPVEATPGMFAFVPPEGSDVIQN